MAPVLGDDRAMMRAGEEPSGMQQKFVVLRWRARRFKTAEPLNHGPAEHYGNSVGYMIYLQQFLVVICFEHRPTWRASIGPIQRNVINVAHHETCFRVLCKAGYVRLHSLWSQPIIGIEKKGVFPATGTETRVAGSSQTSIFLSHTSNTGITPHHLPNIVR
jgi:hypothetical protein